MQHVIVLITLYVLAVLLVCLALWRWGHHLDRTAIRGLDTSGTAELDEGAQAPADARRVA